MPARRTSQPPRSGNPWRAVGYTLAGLAAALAAAVTILLVFAPTDVVRDRLVAEVKARTGRTLTIAGPTSLGLFPSLAVSFADVTLSPPPGMAGEPLAKLERVDARLALLALLSGETRIESLVLVHPRILLAVDGQGRRSWDFASIDLPAGIRLAEAGDTNASLQGLARNAAKATAEKAAFTLGDVEIVGGVIGYQDQRIGVRDEISALDARIAAADLASPADVHGQFTFRGERVDITARAGPLQAFVAGTPAHTTLLVSSARGRITYDGDLSPIDLSTTGHVAINGPSLKHVAAWLGAEVPGVPGLGSFEATGTLRTTPLSAALADAMLSLDGQRATGTIRIDHGPRRPLVTATLAAGAIDLNLYAPDGTSPLPPVAADRVLRGSTPEAPSTGTSAPVPPPPVAGTRVRGFTQRAGWSEEPFDTRALRAVDVDARLSATALVWRQVKVGTSTLRIALKDEVLDANLDDVALYNGRGAGVITLDARQEGLGLGVRLGLDNVAALPLLRDGLGFDWVDGRARIDLALSGQGGSERQIVETLSGRITTELKDGAVIGLNIPQMLRGLGQGRIPGMERAPAEKTDFTEMSVSYQVANGIAQASDLKASSPLLRVTGAGSFDMPRRTLDWTIRPKVVGTLTGQGGPINLAGLEVPVRIAGSWEQPKVTADVGSLLKDPDKALEAAKQIGQQLKDSGIGNALKNLLGGIKQK